MVPIAWTAAYKPWAYTALHGVLEGLINRGAYIRGGLYIFVRGFSRAYKQRGLYPRVAYTSS